MAWAEKLPGGRWRGGWRDPSGNKHYTRRPEFPEHPYERKKDARAAAQEAEVRAQRVAAVEHGTLSASIPWGDWWDLIAPDRASEESNSDSIEQWIVERYLRPKWGATPLNEIKHKPVQHWVNDLDDGRAIGWERTRRPGPAYVAKIYTVFRASIRLAVDDDVLTASPCAGVTLPKVPRKRKQHLTVAEAGAIGPNLRADYRDAVDLLHETGLRPGELCGLHADQIDWERSMLEVCMVQVIRKHVIRPWPKDKDARVVPLTRKAVEILRRRLDGRALTGGCGMRHTDDATCDSVLVFLTELGRPMKPGDVTDRLRHAAKMHGVPRRTAYSARRGAATRVAEGGLDVFTMAEVFGWADIKMAREYVQETQAAHARVLAALGEQQPLTVVPGADPGPAAPAWGTPGADPRSDIVVDRGTDRDQNAG